MRGRKEIILGDKKSRRRTTGGLKRRLRNLALAALGLSWIAWAAGQFNEQIRVRQVYVDISRIERAARMFRADHGRCPDSLDELLEPPGDETYIEDTVDPWGQPYFFSCPSRRDPGGVEVVSAGPNRVPYGGDDINSL